MGEWYNVMVLRKYFITHLPVNKKFNIEEVSGMKFDHPELFVNYLNLINKKNVWDANLEIMGEYPNYYFSYDKDSIDDKSVVQLLVIEGDF